MVGYGQTAIVVRSEDVTQIILEFRQFAVPSEIILDALGRPFLLTPAVHHHAVFNPHDQ